MASSEKGHIDTLQKRAEQAAALRAAADADYKDVSTQLQAERFRVETLKVGLCVRACARVCVCVCWWLRGYRPSQLEAGF